MSGNPKSILKKSKIKATPKTPTVSPFTRAQQFELRLREFEEDFGEKLFEKMNPYHSYDEIKRLEEERDARQLKEQQEDEAIALSRRDNKLDPDQAGYYSDSPDEDDPTPERIARNAARIDALEEFYSRHPGTRPRIAESFPKMGDTTPPPSPPPSPPRSASLPPEMLLGGIPKPPSGGRKTKKRSKSLFPRSYEKASKIAFKNPLFTGPVKRERRKATEKKTKKRNKKLVSRKTARNKKS